MTMLLAVIYCGACKLWQRICTILICVRAEQIHCYINIFDTETCNRVNSRLHSTLTDGFVPPTTV